MKDGQKKRARFTEDQILGVLKEHEGGAKTADPARKDGVSEAMLYNGKAKYGGMDVCEAKRLKQLGDANAKLKKLLAEQMLDAAALCELLSKKGWGPPSRAKASRIFGPRWACRNGGPARSSALTARWSVTAHAGRQTGSFGRNCAISPTREAFRISSAVRPVAAGGRALGHQPHLPAGHLQVPCFLWDDSA